MRLIDSISKLFSPTRREDPTFGQMTYMGDRLKYWEGKALFKPTNVSVEVFVDGSANDDMALQRDVFEQLMNEWSSFGPAIDRLLIERLRDRDPNLRVESACSVFEISSLSVPTESIIDASWENNTQLQRI